MLEEEGQRVEPGPCVLRREVEDDRRLPAGCDSLDDPGLPPLAEELADDIEGTHRVLPPVRDDDPHLEPRNAGHHLSRDGQLRLRAGAHEREDGKDEDDSASTCGSGQT
jgi:hypothetical protein